MRDNEPVGEDARMPEQPSDLTVVQQRLEEIQRHKRGRMRWSVSKHTAELALGALREEPPRRDRSSKHRRRKRHKRLL